MKKKIIAIMAAAIVVTGSVTGGTMAVYQASTKTDKTISTSSLGIELNIEGNIDAQGDIVFHAEDIADGRVSEKVSAVNTGSKDQYLRVRINKAWYEGAKKIYEKNGKDIRSDYIGISTCNTNDWMLISDDDDNGEDLYIYYKKILKAGDQTSAFCDAFTVFENVFENTNTYSGLSIKIRFDADAVQTIAATDAILAEWGILATMDSDGTIISLQNQ